MRDRWEAELKNILLTRAEQFCNGTVVSAFFWRWQKELILSCTARTFKTYVLKRFFYDWIVSAQLRRAARSFYNDNLTEAYWSNWKRKVVISDISRAKLKRLYIKWKSRTLSNRNLNGLRKAFSHWKRRFKARSFQRIRTNIFVTTWAAKQTLRRVFLAWNEISR